MNTHFVNYLARCIHYHRKQSGLTQRALAQFAGVGKTVIYDIEHGKASIQLNTLLKILNILNISIHLEGPLMKSFEEIEHEAS